MGAIINNIGISAVAVIIAPLLGGLLSGLDRKITARMQNRMGPPVFQPFYDFFKLLGKEGITVNQTQMAYVIGHFLFMAASLIMLVLRQDMLMLIFIMAFSSVSLIMGAMSVRSPYSKIGAQREIIQIMAYEPVMLLMVVGVYLTTKSFMIESIIKHDTPLLYNLPMVFLSLLFVMTIKMRKSPFDFSASHHAHQELIKGLTTEFSGPQLAIIELTHWYELVLLFGLISLFFAKPLWVGILIAAASFFMEIVIDNISARMTWKWMLKAVWLLGIGAAMTNIIWLYLR
ncbi:respiratory chain complex I subunit 1 family protein [Clostridium thermosuccinogenes]|uniref:respiratory chain complex I subunit 1 family protein n=1 Tax=Clostridium thermosuccinogenes TaxID=84032 RepID=UPI000CCBDE1C|nr:complex I subunit 1 family protein [Pseudoclostridium thermosuccinogenes]PNT91024.1 Ech hydrogenase subunit EchB [Pseudoclostridium thermosuccinogenes]